LGRGQGQGRQRAKADRFIAWLYDGAIAGAVCGRIAILAPITAITSAATTTTAAAAFAFFAAFNRLGLECRLGLLRLALLRLRGLTVAGLRTLVFTRLLVPALG
jgi:hypothetical protein